MIGPNTIGRNTTATCFCGWRIQTSSGFEKAQSESPLGYGHSPSDIAEAVVFLFGAKLVTAQLLVVDAGEHLLGRSRDVVFETEGLDG